MVTKMKVAFSILAALDLIYIATLLLGNKDEYIYSKFVFDIRVLAFNLAILIILNLFVILIVFSAKRIITFIYAFILLVPPAFFVCVVVFMFSYGSFWKSETKDYSNFDSVDGYLDSILTVADLKISDIIKTDAEAAGDFYYSYQSEVAVCHFAFKAELHLSEQDYESIKGAFEKAKEFKANMFTFEQQQALNITGCYEFDSQVPMLESSTSVDYWYTVVINFCDDKKIFLFDLRGDCYT